MARINVKFIENLLNKYKKHIFKGNNWINYCKNNWQGKKNSRYIKQAITKFCDKDAMFFKNNNHTRRIYKSAMANLKKHLILNISEIQKMKKFDDIFKYIADLKINRIGDGLTVYDISILLSACIGLDLNKEPQYVYSHAGTARGIKSLCKLCTVRKRKYEIKELDIGLNNVFTKSKLPPAHLEHFFCIWENLKNKNILIHCNAFINSNGC